MTSICKEKDKSPLGCIQNCGYTMPRAFINLKSTKCLSKFVISMLEIMEHWAFTYVMDAKTTSCTLAN